MVNKQKRYTLGNEHLIHEHPTNFHWHHNRTCSHCGSISPDFFFEALAAGCELAPADKSYKVVIHHHDHFHIPVDHNYFIYQHFSKEEKLKFVEMMNIDELDISDPGHFYVNPFFVIDTLHE